MILIVIGLSVWLIFHIKSEEYKCIAKPLQYVASHFTSSDGSSVTCSCGSSTSPSAIRFNSTTTWSSSSEILESETDISNFKITT